MVKDETVRDLGERTMQFALEAIRLFGSLAKSEEARVLGRQFLRSATSVGANYREARRGRSKAEFVAKIGDCLKELDETSYWFALLEGAKIFPSSRLSGMRDECEQLIAIFTTISKKAKVPASKAS
jgi:four helix bundle protein